MPFTPTRRSAAALLGGLALSPLIGRAGFALTGFAIRAAIKQQRDQVAMPAQCGVM